MSTQLAAQPVDPDQLDLLSLVADEQTPLGSLRREDFRGACQQDAATHRRCGPPVARLCALASLVRRGEPALVVRAVGSGVWTQGFLDKTDVWAPIDPAHSKGNGNKPCGCEVEGRMTASHAHHGWSMVLPVRPQQRRVRDATRYFIWGAEGVDVAGR